MECTLSVQTQRKSLVLYTANFRAIDTYCILQLYRSLVLMHLEFASAIYNGHHTCSKGKKIESVQKFVLRLIAKCWDQSYDELLDTADIPSLERCREVTVTCLCLLDKIIQQLWFFGSCVFTFSSTRNYYASHYLTLNYRFSHTICIHCFPLLYIFGIV